jgi:hypothetical protein
VFGRRYDLRKKGLSQSPETSLEMISLFRLLDLDNRFPVKSHPTKPQLFG